MSVNNYDAITTTYNFTNQPTTTTRQHFNTTSTTTPLITVANRYIYDNLGRKLKSWETINTGNGTSGTRTLLSQTVYNEIGQVSTKQLHSTDSVAFSQNESYTYNERGWLRTSTSGLNGTNLLTLDLRYNTPDAGSAKFNGNITEMLYAAPYSSRTFYYTYDPLNRLNSANSGAGNTVGTLDESIAYDNMGNITGLTRTGSSAATLTYSYLDGSNNYTNQLHSVQNAGAAYRTYAYDLNGNATSDGGTKTINYNIFNLPQTLVQSGSTIATYTYDAGGSKLRTVSTTDGTWDYIGGVVYKNGALSFIQTEEGKALWNGSAYQYQYNLKDHLGNVRVTFTKNNTTGLAQELQEDEYYAFGLSKLLYDNSNGNRYLYNGKELQEETGVYDYGHRQYDPVIGRFTTIDPLAKDYYHLTPYNYAENNPILMIDPDGMGSDTTKKVNPPPPPIELKEVTITARPNHTFAAAAGLILLRTGARTGVAWGVEAVDPEPVTKTVGAVVMTVATIGFLGYEIYNYLHQSKSYDANDQELPTIDNTGKVHGELPDPNDMNKFPKDKLKQFLRDLKRSVQQRQGLNQTLGVDPGHATRVDQELRLIRVISKILSGS